MNSSIPLKLKSHNLKLVSFESSSVLVPSASNVIKENKGNKQMKQTRTVNNFNGWKEDFQRSLVYLVYSVF